MEDIDDIIHDFKQAMEAAGVKPGQKGGDPFEKAMELVNGGFMGKVATGAPRPGTDGTIGEPEPAAEQDRAGVVA